MRVFITYGDEGYETAKAKIVSEAKATGVFDAIYSYGREDLSLELISSDIIKIKRGGGLWSWKPDVILSTLHKLQDGDIVVYCDAGCSLYPSPEWKEYFRKLENYDIIAQRIFQKTQQWTRREIIDYFEKSNGLLWLSQCQYQATTILLKVSDFTKLFVKEWLNLMIEHPEFVTDVPKDKFIEQLPGFIENRHDQAIYSALIYKYRQNPKFKKKIYTQWEHIEDYDPLSKQAIRATRLRQGQQETLNKKFIACCKRLVKDWIYKPLFFHHI